MHHAADLTEGGDVVVSESERPITLADRLGKVGHLLNLGLPIWIFDLPERILKRSLAWPT